MRESERSPFNSFLLYFSFVDEENKVKRSTFFYKRLLVLN